MFSLQSADHEPSDIVGLFGILVGLSVLIWFAFRSWSVLLLAPIAALTAAFLSREPLLAVENNSIG